MVAEEDRLLLRQQDLPEAALPPSESYGLTETVCELLADR